MDKNQPRIPKVKDKILIKGIAVDAWYLVKVSNVHDNIITTGDGMGTHIVYTEHYGRTWKWPSF